MDAPKCGAGQQTWYVFHLAEESHAACQVQFRRQRFELSAIRSVAGQQQFKPLAGRRQTTGRLEQHVVGFQSPQRADGDDSRHGDGRSGLGISVRDHDVPDNLMRGQRNAALFEFVDGALRVADGIIGGLQSAPARQSYKGITGCSVDCEILEDVEEDGALDLPQAQRA